jgi:hypothetical protein
MANEDFKALIEILKDELVEFAYHNDFIKEKLNEQEHVELLDSISDFSDQEILSIFLGEATENIRDFQSKFGKFLRYSLALIASGALVGAPLLGPLLYFLYRKAMDPCTKTCDARFSMRGPAGKKCKYFCQMRAILDTIRKLKGDLPECSRQKKRKKCENRIKKAILKWEKKYADAKTNFEKADEKMRERRRKKFGYEESVRLKKLSEQDYDKAEPGEALIKPSEPNPRIDRIVRVALVGGLFAVPIPLISVAANEITKRFDFTCMRRCFAKPNVNKKFCYHQCRYYGRQNAVRLLNKGLAGCSKAANPPKCRHKMLTLLKDWRKREIQSRYTYQKELDKQRAKLTRD